MILRCVRTESAPVPTTSVVRFDELDAVLPPGTEHVTPEQRAHTIANRHAAVAAAIRQMSVDVSSLDPDVLEAAARSETNLGDLGDGSHREGLERFTAALRERRISATPA